MTTKGIYPMLPALVGEAMTHFVELVKALAWPLVVLIVAFSFRAQFKDLFNRSSGVTFEIPGVKLQFGMTVEEVHDVAQELFKEVSEGLTKLTEKQRELFDEVRTSNGIKTVDQLTQEVFSKPFFKDSDEHEEFRALRDSKLIGRERAGGGRQKSMPWLHPMHKSY